MSGWIKLHRKLLDSPLWKDCNNDQRALLITILLKANHESNRWIFDGVEYQVREGEFITSIKSLSESANLSFQTTRTAIKKFEKYNFLTNKSTNKNRLITVVNWDKYQSLEEQLTNNLTSNQQAPNRQLTTNKNDKNDKNVRSNIYSSKFEDLWKQYPKKNNKNRVTKNALKEIEDHPEVVQQALNNYLEEIRLCNRDIQYIKNGTTFFNGDWRGYTNNNWVRPGIEKKSSQKQSKFNSFNQRDYDMSEIEKNILGWVKE